MKAEYGKYYPCKKGLMPEDFENVGIAKEVIVAYKNIDMPKKVCYKVDERRTDAQRDARWFLGSSHEMQDYLAWTLPQPYKQ